MPTAKLTTRLIDSLKTRAEAQSKADFVWDTEISGFGVRMSPKGAASYVVQKSVGGRQGKDRRVTIGHYPGLKLDDARQEAIRVIGQVNDGIDVAQLKKQKRDALRDKLNTELLPTFQDYYRRKAQEGRYWPEVERIYVGHIIPTLGKTTPVSSITKADIRALIEAKEEVHPDAARNWFAYLRPFFKWCVERDLIAVSPMDSLTPPPVCEARDRILTEEEIKLFWNAAKGLGYPFGSFYLLLLLTGQRRDEVAGMQRSEIDLGAAVWIIPKERTKNGKEHLVHLSPQAVAIINGLPSKPSQFLFTTTNDKPISGFSKAKGYLDCAMLGAVESQEFLPQNCKPWRVHDLRRTAASGMAELGFQPHIVERVLNHISGAQGGLVGVYQRFHYADERKRALEAWGSRVQAVASGRAAASNVIQIGEKR